MKIDSVFGQFLQPKPKVIRNDDSRRLLDKVYWDNSLQGYRYKDSDRSVGQRNTYRIVSQEIQAYENAITRLTNGLLNQTTSFEEWQVKMSDLTRESFINQLRIGRGGTGNTYAIHYLNIGRELKDTQYPALRQFAVDIKFGNLSPAQIANRAKYYARSSRSAYEYARQEYEKEKGDISIQAKRSLGACGPHCPECLEYASYGWVPLNQLILPTKQCSCRMNCCCSVQYRSRTT